MISLELYSLPPYILGGPGLSYTNVHIKKMSNFLMTRKICAKLILTFICIWKLNILKATFFITMSRNNHYMCSVLACKCQDFLNPEK